MMRRFADVLADGAGKGRAALGCTCYDLPTAAAVLDAAERAGAGIVLLVSSQAFAARTGPALVAGLLALGDAAGVPVSIQLDHEGDLARIRAALDAGVGAVMADGSTLGYEDNVALVAEAARLAAPHGAQVEAELGRVEGDEESAAAVAAGALTDPDEARDFMRRTGAHCLAVSIGNVHGTYHGTPQLDWARLERLRRAVPAPLSLHGASGLAPGDLRRAVAGGIAKVNVNTELRQAWFGAVLDRAPALAGSARLLQLQHDLRAAVEPVVAEKLAAVDPRAAVPDPAPEEASTA